MNLLHNQSLYMPDLDLDQLSFPPTFQFGVADADLQVIGENNTIKFESSQPTMWRHFAKTSGQCHNNDGPGQGIDRYHRWREDIEIMKVMGVKNYRLSISMARMLKKNGEVNLMAIKWYKNYLRELKKAKIYIFATLYHWELPQSIQQKGGWENIKNIEFFIKHATAVVQNLGDYIDEYFIVNEPWCISMLSNCLGFHAPGNKKLKTALQVAHNLLLTIGLTYQKLIEINPFLKIGTVFNSEPAYAYSANEKNIQATLYKDQHFNRWFMDPIFLGKYPEEISGLYKKDMPIVTKEDMKIIKIGNKLYSFGLNYYCGKIIKFDKKSDLKFKEVFLKNGEKNSLGWPVFSQPVYPEGLYDMLQQVYFSYKNFGLKRIYVTENGLALKTVWNGKDKIIKDTPRIKYLKNHIGQVHKAIVRGIPVEGYFAWTFMDNYEWAEGYRPESCFGLIHVDRKTMKRIWKKSAHWYKKLINLHVVPE